ncbi:hypothetical protein C4J92_3382 [Pseudomonas sp. R3-18-08]|nr:hypothetical protein C4J92_3382 [Pseudomonas sp. R3-18-08]
MTASLFKDGFPSTRQRIERSIDLRRLFFAIDSDPALIGRHKYATGYRQPYTRVASRSVRSYR